MPKVFSRRSDQILTGVHAEGGLPPYVLLAALGFGGGVPGIDRGEITSEEYSDLDEAHYRVHWLMQRAYLAVRTDEALYGLEQERAGIVAKLQRAHESNPDRGRA